MTQDGSWPVVIGPSTSRTSGDLNRLQVFRTQSHWKQPSHQQHPRRQEQQPLHKHQQDLHDNLNPDEQHHQQQQQVDQHLAKNEQSRQLQPRCCTSHVDSLSLSAAWPQESDQTTCPRNRSFGLRLKCNERRTTSGSLLNILPVRRPRRLSDIPDLGRNLRKEQKSNPPSPMPSVSKKAGGSMRGPHANGKSATNSGKTKGDCIGSALRSENTALHTGQPPVDIQAAISCSQRLLGGAHTPPIAADAHLAEDVAVATRTAP